ncbi:MAG: ABC transporter ATP-binding protein [Zoogloea sp.]|nr:ABC transporter ATP-binding protein [Zoogloea sp.]
MLELVGLSCGYNRRSVLEDISLTLDGGELLCLLGPNGVGKTTLFKTILGLLPPCGGEIRLDGEPIERWSRRRFASRVGYVPQAHTPPFPFKVREVVAMGRTAHLGSFSSPRAADRAIADEALDTLGIAMLADASYTEISGGERQLVLIARALAQQPRVLVMDEPTSNLDYGNQLKVMAHIHRIVASRGMGIILTTHHPNHALLYASRVLVLDRDKRYTVGTPAEVITETYLRHTYGVDTEIHDITRRNGQLTRMCVPYQQHTEAEPCRS